MAPRCMVDGARRPMQKASQERLDRKGPDPLPWNGQAAAIDRTFFSPSKTRPDVVPENLLAMARGRRGPSNPACQTAEERQVWLKKRDLQERIKKLAKFEVAQQNESAIVEAAAQQQMSLARLITVSNIQ